MLFDLFDAFINPLETELGVRASHSVGRSHGMGVYATYKTRIDAVNFVLVNDDGTSTRHYSDADIVLIGVSRSGKTPNCLYLALHYGILAANYPLTEDDLNTNRLPETLAPYRDKLFGLTIDPNRLQQIRKERRPNSPYASAQQCRFEVTAVEAMYQQRTHPLPRHQHRLHRRNRHHHSSEEPTCSGASSTSHAPPFVVHFGLLAELVTLDLVPDRNLQAQR